MLQKTSGKMSVLTMALAGFLFIGSANPVHAYATCDQKIHKAQRNLERAIQRYGLHSAQAERRRDQLERVRARCSR